MTNISFGFENPLKIRFGDEYFKNLPKDPGVYTFLDRHGVPLYIGKADNLKRRLMSYQAAKPGQATDHILEMIEHAVDLRFEVFKCGTDALKRESELIRSVRPRYNVALNYDVNYLYVGFRTNAVSASASKLEFRLSHMDIHEGFTSFGCFRHRGKVKAGYSALLRLIFAAHCPRERFLLPARICRSSPAYDFSIDIPQATLAEMFEHLEQFFAGKNSGLLRYLLDRLLAKDELPKELYIPLQRDSEIAKELFRFGPQDTLKLARKLRSRNGKIAQEAMDSFTATEFEATLRAVPKTVLKTRPTSRPASRNKLGKVDRKKKRAAAN